MGLQNGFFLALIVPAIGLGSSDASSSCTVCQDGSPILHPEAFVEETEQTCAEMAEEATYYSDPISCRYYHRYGNECGCNNIPPTETFCQLCQDGSPVPDGSLLLEGYDGNCDLLQADAAWNLWSTIDAEEGDGQADTGETCNYYHHAGKLCGCPNNAPPQNGCKLCLDGEPPLMPNKVVTPGNAAEETCEAFSLFTQYLQVDGTEECTKSQSVVGSYCGCSETPTSDTPVACDYCPPGLVTKEGMATKIDFIAHNKVFYFRDAACIKITMLAADFDFPCDNVPSTFIDGCCEPASALLGPEVFIQGAVDREPEVEDVPETDDYYEAEVQQVEIDPVIEEIATAVTPIEGVETGQAEKTPHPEYVIDTSTVGLGTASRQPSQETVKLPLRGSTQDSVGMHETKPPSGSIRDQHGWVHDESQSNLGGRYPIPDQSESKEVNWDEFVFLYVSSATRPSWGAIVTTLVTVFAVVWPLIDA